MDTRIHFISGLPRSGSTLLSAILAQNPRFHAGMSSPVGGIYKSLQETMSQRHEASIFITDKQRGSVLKGLFGSYYADIPQSDVVFDTNRMWCTKTSSLSRLFPRAKIICCVRSISWIIDSIEQLVQKNAFEPSGIFGFDAGGTIYTRVSALAGATGLVGYALDALKEGYFSKEAGRMILVEYQSLCRAPHATMKEIYRFIDEPWFEHDFNNVEYEANEFDLQMGVRGLHTIRQKVEWVERPTILPPDIFNRFQNDMFWRNIQPSRCPLIDAR